MEKHENEIELIEILNIIWKRKWIIIIPTLLLVIATGVTSSLLPKKWEIDTLIVPGKFILQSEGGSYEEVLVADPKQIASQINQASYDLPIASELNLNIREFPKLKAENIRDTNLVRISTKATDVEKAKFILSSLFKHLQNELSKKIDVEIKGIDTRIATNTNLIKHKEFTIKDNFNEIKIKENEIAAKKIDIRSKEIDKTKRSQEILSAENKLLISQERTISIMEEMESVKTRIDELEEQLKKALAEEKEGIEAISLLLYSNEVQQNLRYYNTLDEKINTEKIIQENLNLLKKDKKEEINQLDTQIEKLRTEIETIKTRINENENTIDKINNEIENVKNQIDLLTERKARIDYTRLIKGPTSSLGPVSPNKKLNVLIAGFIGLVLFSLLAFLLEYIKTEKQI